MDTPCASPLLLSKILAKTAIFFISVFGIDSVALGQQAPLPDSGDASTRGTHDLRPVESENARTAEKDVTRKAEIENLQGTKMALLHEMEQAMAKVVKGGAKARHEAVEQWREQNGERLRALQEQAIALANSEPEVKPVRMEQAGLPENASEELRALLNQRMLLYNGKVETLEQMAKHPEQADAIARKENARWERDTALLGDLAQAVARQSEQQPILIPPPIEIPPGLAPEVHSLLVERNSLLNERANAMKQNPPKAGQPHGDWLMRLHQIQPDRIQKLQKQASEAAEK